MITSKKILSVFSLTMINIIAVDSLRTLPISAEYGFSLVFFYLIAGLCFFLPTALISAELATAWPNTGGAYIWIREAFGAKVGLVAIGLQWIYNVVWYPTILAFIAGTLAYLVNPALANNKIFMVSIVLGLFWGTTLLSCLGLRTASWMSAVGALIGTLVPMILIILLGLLWLKSGKVTEITFSLKSFLPTSGSLNNLVFFSAVLFSLMGLEMSAVHAGDVKNPKRDYPRALIYSGLLIFISLVLASLAIAVVVPPSRLNVLSNLTDAFVIFFHAHNLSWMIPVIIVLIILGSAACVSAWVIGPTRGLLIASEDGHFAPFWEKTNRYNMPTSILLLQAVLVTLLSVVFLLLPTVNSAYWLLSALTSQLALLFYLFLFAAAIRLRYKKPHVTRAYRIPFGNLGMWLVAGVGILTCVATILISFLPPSQLSVGSLISYELTLGIGTVFFCTLPLVVYRKR